MSSYLPEGVEVVRRLRGHKQIVYRLRWSQDGVHVLSASRDRTVRTWNVQHNQEVGRPVRISNVKCLDWSPDGQLLATGSGVGSSNKDIRLRSMRTGNIHWSRESHRDTVLALDWSPDGQYLASASADNTIRIWEVRRWQQHREFDHPADAVQIAWSPDGKTLATGGRDRTVRVWDVHTSRLLKTFIGHSRAITSLTWSRDGQILVSGSEDHTIHIWDVTNRKPITSLESHTAAINSLSYSHDGSLLASKAQDDTVRLWNTDTWRLVGIHRETSANYPLSEIAFHPQYPLLATLSEKGLVIDVLKLDIKRLKNATPEVPTVHYSNAKVVLVGDGGAGKTSLGRALNSLPFERQEPTHGLNLWRFDSHQAEFHGQGIEREILLWDLAGQENYRLIHQLYLKDVALALLVFDGTSTEPFKSIQYWNRALDQTRSVKANRVQFIDKILVEARIDIGGSSVTQEYLEQYVKEHDFVGYIRTSAQHNTNIIELADMVREKLNWRSVASVSSTDVFQKIKAFLQDFRNDENQPRLATVNHLYAAFVKAQIIQNPEDYPDLYEQFETCVGFLEALGVIRQFKFGRMVLLQPELVDFYASAIINAAKNASIERFGVISERRIWEIEFPIPQQGRLEDPHQERWMLLATVDDLINYEIVFRDEGELIFPSHFVQELRNFFDMPEQREINVEFEGPISNLYAMIVVRLSRTEEFTLEKISRNRVLLKSHIGGYCGLELHDRGDGRGSLDIYFDEKVKKIVRHYLEMFVRRFLTHYAVEDSVKRTRLFFCPECNIAMDPEHVEKRLARNMDTMNCPVCERKINLTDPMKPEIERVLRPKMHMMDKQADIARERDASASILEGKKATDNYDVFVMHHPVDHTHIQKLNARLEERGIYSWITDREIKVREAMETVIPKVKSVSIIFGSSGLGSWQASEVITFVDDCRAKGLPIILVLLPQSGEVPHELLYHRNVKWVYFFDSLDDTLALDELEAGITGKKQDWVGGSTPTAPGELPDDLPSPV